MKRGRFKAKEERFSDGSRSGWREVEGGGSLTTNRSAFGKGEEAGEEEEGGIKRLKNG